MIATQLRLILQAIRLDAHRPSFSLRPADAGTALRYLPLAGALSGVLFAILYVLLSQLLPHTVAVVLALCLVAWSAAGSHEIGWAGLCDELAAQRERRLHGAPFRAAGALALVLLIALKIEVLASLDPSWISIAVIVAHALSRGLAVAVTSSLRAPLRESHARGTLPHPSALDGTIALMLGLLPAAAATLWLGQTDAFASALAPAVAVGAWLRRQQRRRLERAGTHSVHGIQQATELAFLLGLLVWWTLAAPIEEAPFE